MQRPQPLAPGPGQESVWDYPRPPALERSSKLIEVKVGVVTVASTRASLRVLETSHPPVYYLPFIDLTPGVLRDTDGSSFCEWKGRAQYWTVVAAGMTIERAGWSYPHPLHLYQELATFIAFYPGRVECYVEGERVRPQQGGFYGGWITDEVVGPFKGTPGTRSW